MVDPVTIGYGVNKWLNDSSTDFITLSKTGSTTAATSLYSLYGGGGWADFVVPAGKKFIPLVIQFQSDDNGGTGTGNGFVRLSDGASGVPTNTKFEFQIALENSRDVFMSLDVFLDGWAATEHVNVAVNSTTEWGIVISGILTTV